VEFDPLLYVSLAAGWGIGRLVPVRGPWVPRATLATVMVLLAFLGASLRGVGLLALAGVIPLSLVYVALLLGLTAGVFLLLELRRTEPSPTPPPLAPPAFPTSLVLLAALLGGFGLGGIVSLPAHEGITLTLYVLLGLVGLTIEFRRDQLRRAWAPISAAFVGAVLAALVVTAWARTALGVSLAVGLSFGWYSLAGPLVSSRAGAALGLLAFLTNFLREILTMVLAPRLGSRLGGAGLAALGGATAMDTTLPFVTRYGSEESASLALASGLTLTVAAGLLLPLVLAV
jgi:Lysine exporter LysO